MTVKILWPPCAMLLPLTQDRIDVWAVDLSQSLMKLPTWFQLLSVDEKQRAERFHFDKHRHRFILARAGLRQILSYYLQMSAQDIQFAYTSYGKPYLSEQQNFYFNMSHAEDLAIYAINQLGEVGVDVEFIQTEIDAEAIATRFFSAEEVAALKNLPLEEKRLGFYNGWTRKEAFIKAIGEGFSCPLNSFAVTLAPAEQAKIISIHNNAQQAQAWSLLSFNPASNYIAALAIKGKIPSVVYSTWLLN